MDTRAAAAEGCGLTVLRDGCKRNVNPFARLSSLVLRDLFAMAEARGIATPVSIAQMVQRTGLDEKSIHRISGCLGRRRFAKRRQYALTLVQPAQTLEAWLAEWDGNLQPTQSFHVGLKWSELVPALLEVWRGLDWAWTGAAGAALVANVGVPMQRVCYVAARDEAMARARLLRLLPTLAVEGRDNGTMHVVVPLCERSQLAFGRRLAPNGAPVVSTLQLALDLERGPGGAERVSVLDAGRCALRSTLLGRECGDARLPGD